MPLHRMERKLPALALAGLVVVVFVVEVCGRSAAKLFGIVKSSKGHWVVVINLSNLPRMKRNRQPCTGSLVQAGYCIYCILQGTARQSQKPAEKLYGTACVCAAINDRPASCASTVQVNFSILWPSHDKQHRILMPTKPAACRSIQSSRPICLRNPPHNRQHPWILAST